MDPNANLAEQDQILYAPDDRERLAELRLALHAWLACGGFPPAWTKYPEATNAYVSWANNGTRAAWTN